MERLRSLLTFWFFANFFYLLFLAICVSEWVMLCWLLLYPWATSIPFHLVGLSTVYLLNRHGVNATRYFSKEPRPRTILGRVYYSVIFCSFFYTAYLALVGVAWAATSGVATLLHTDTSAGSLTAPFRTAANLGVAAITLVLLYGYTIGQHRLKVRRIKIPMRNLPAGLAGFRIVQLSDIHIGQIRPSDVSRFVKLANEIKPDLICITGDIADSVIADLDGVLPILARLEARCGVLVILGNHDHYCGANRVIEAIARHTEFRVLLDSNCHITLNGETLYVIGLDDRSRTHGGANEWARGVVETRELTRLMNEVPTNSPVLLLSHRGDIFPQAVALGIGLTLAGHTHGGQLGIPWLNGRTLNPARMLSDFDRGLFHRNGSYLYVNCGLGMTIQQVRVGTPREISVFELQTPDATRS